MSKKKMVNQSAQMLMEMMRIQTAKAARQENIKQYWKRKSTVTTPSHRLDKKGNDND